MAGLIGRQAAVVGAGMGGLTAARAQDLVQATFERTYRSWARARDGSPFDKRVRRVPSRPAECQLVGFCEIGQR